jgi:hypothetical protein
MKVTCVACGRKVDVDRGDHLFNRPSGEQVWLCGRVACWDKYNGTEARE